MVEVYWEINGRRVSPNQVGSALERSIYQQIAEQIKKQLSSVRCAEHGQQPKVVFNGKSGNEMNFSIEGCCEQLIEKATAEMK